MIVHLLPEGFVVRPPTLDDAPPVHDLLQACARDEYGTDEPMWGTREALQAEWQAPGVDLATDAWLVTTPDGRLAGYALAAEEGVSAASIGMTTRVAPAHRGRGISTFLLSRVEQWAHQQLAKAPPSPHATLTTWISHVNEAARQLLEQVGYRRRQSSWLMEIRMHEAPAAPTWPQGLMVRTVVPGPEERIVFETVQEAFGDLRGYLPPSYEEWEHWMVKREDGDPSLWFLAWDEQELAGCSLCEYRAGGGWVEQLAVRRPWRQRGLGMALLLHSFGAFYRRGTTEVRLLVDAESLTGATRLYERAGMQSIRQYDNYEKELHTSKGPHAQVAP
jgi:mycothiol synthase